MVRKLIFFIILAAIVLIGGSFWFINILNEKYDDFKEKKAKEIEILTQKKETLRSENELYSFQIKEKAKDIEELSSKLEDIEKIIGLKVDDDQDLMARASIAKITSVQRLYTLDILPNGFPLKLNREITSNFGYRIHPVTKNRKFHYGIDLKANSRTRVYATADGVIDFVQDKNRGSFGRLVRISHNYGFQTIYAHLAQTRVKAGDVVKKGDIIGLTGRSGRVSGPHLHYEIKYGIKSLDPKPFLEWGINNYESIFEKQRRVKWEKIINLMEAHKEKQQLR
jgi:murein DD-endopeptidase MepM/ murein hydrolase activator NlpD